MVPVLRQAVQARLLVDRALIPALQADTPGAQAEFPLVIQEFKRDIRVARELWLPFSIRERSPWVLVVKAASPRQALPAAVAAFKVVAFKVVAYRVVASKVSRELGSEAA